MPTVLRVAALPEELRHRRSTGEPLGLWRVLSEPGGLSHLRAHVERLPPGRWSAAPHRHSHREEVAYVLSGRVSLWVDGVETELDEGTAAAFEAGGEGFHSLVNRGEADATVLWFSATPEPDEVRYAPDDAGGD